jgi:hypothetical protein
MWTDPNAEIAACRRRDARTECRAFDGEQTVGSARAIARTQPNSRFLVARNQRSWSLLTSEELEKIPMEPSFSE